MLNSKSISKLKRPVELLTAASEGFRESRVSFQSKLRRSLTFQHEPGKHKSIECPTELPRRWTNIPAFGQKGYILN